MEKAKQLWKNIAVWFLTLTVLFTSVQWPQAVFAAEIPNDLTTEEAFALKDENFQCKDAYWDQFQMVWEGYSTKAAFNPEADGMRVDIDDVGANGSSAGLWTVSLAQDTTFYAGRTYEISFDLSSTIKRAFEYGVEYKDGSGNTVNVFNELTGIEENQVGDTQHFSYTYKVGSDKDVNGSFYIHLGAPGKNESLDPHSIKVSNVRAEVQGARENWVMVDDHQFTEKNGAVFSDGSAAQNGYAFIAKDGSLTYKGLNVTAGTTYQLTFGTRSENKDNLGKITVKAGDKVLESEKKIGDYTEELFYEYAAEQDGTVDLTFSAINGNLLVDDICCAESRTRIALGYNDVPSGLDVDSVSLEADPYSYAMGEDVTVTVKSDDFEAWKAKNPVLQINGKTLDASAYELTNDLIVIKGETFKETGRYTISANAAGYTKANTAIKIMKADGNLIDNGDFEDGFSEWTPYFNEPHAGTAVVTSDYMLKMSISFFLNWWDENGVDHGPVSWSELLTHSEISVSAGRTYNLSFYAKSSIERPIMVEFGDQKYFFKLTPKMQKYTFNYTRNMWAGDGKLALKFHMGPIDEKTAPDNDTGITISKTDGHDIYLADISMLESGHAGDYVRTPSIVGVDDGITYKTPVSVTVNYMNDYTYTLTKDGVAQEYNLGDMIRDNGNYVLTATDKNNASISSQKSFTIQQDIDYSKQYYVIASKATEMVMEAVGNRDGDSVVQRTFTGKPGQFFTIENVRDGYFVLRALSTGKVVQVKGASKDNEARLEQAEYTGDNCQLWKTVTVPQGFVKLENKNSGLVIDVSGAMKIENLPLQQYNNSGDGDEGQQSADGQRFDLIKMSADDVRSYMENAASPAQTEADWIENAFITPHADKLNPAGPIAVEFYAAPGDVKSYDIYFDGEKCKTLNATDDETLKTEDEDIYSTKVASHKMQIVANYNGGKKVTSKEISFYITKKGVGWATLHRTGDMNLSWYYHWALNPAIGTDKDLSFVPMVWGNFGDEWLADPENKKYGTVLSFNEPDWSDQSNVPVTKAQAQAWVERYNSANGTSNTAPKSLEESWQPFMDSGLRIGSPATALAPPYCNGSITMNNVDGPDNWWFDFMDLMNQHEEWDYDFVAIHSYNDGCDADSFLQMIDDTYALTHKPIWITEFGVAKWDGSNGTWVGTPQQREQVKEFMIEVINGLEERDFVERYAWFPFDPNDAFGGASGIFDYATGELNELGQTYAMLGLPEGYKGAEYDVDLETEAVPVTEVTIADSAETVAVGNTLKLSATIKPDDSTIRSVKWRSSDESIAKVDANGIVTPLKAGTVTITAKAGKKSARVKINVTDDPIPVTKVTIDQSKTDLYVGDKLTLKTEVAPANATTKTLKFKSSDTSIAAVDEKTGEVTALKAGTVAITATAKNLQSDMITLTITERPAEDPVPVTKVVIDKSKTELTVGEKMTLSATVAPADATTKTLVYSSEDDSIAYVDPSTGEVTARKAGQVIIKATANNKVHDSFILTVREGAVTPQITVSALTAPKSKLIIGETMQLTAALDGGNTAITYTSSDPSVAEVAADGTVKGVKAGVATITATVGNSAKSVSVQVVKPTVKWNVSYKTCPLQQKKSTTALKAVGLQAGDKVVKYTSSNKKVATVNSKGKITAKKVGKTKITVQTRYGAKATITIKVQKAAVKVTSVAINKKSVSLKKGKTFQIEAVKKYITAANKVTFKSSNTKVATVTSKGKIKAKKKGKAVITVKCGSKTVKVKVTVR